MFTPTNVRILLDWGEPLAVNSSHAAEKRFQVFSRRLIENPRSGWSGSSAVLSLRSCWCVDQDFPASVRLFSPHRDVLGFYRLRFPFLVIRGHLVIADLVGEVLGAGDFNFRWRECQRESRSRQHPRPRLLDRVLAGG